MRAPSIWRLLALLWRTWLGSRVASLVEAEAGHARFGLWRKPAAVQQLAFDRREEALGQGWLVAAHMDDDHPV